MARKRELKAYNVIYADGTYQTFELTRDEFVRLCENIAFDKRVFNTRELLLVLTDVRTIVEHKEPEPVKEESQLTTGVPGGDLQIQAYLNSLAKEAEDMDYERRMFY